MERTPGRLQEVEADLNEEVRKGKLTLAELDEEGESLDRLWRCYRTIQSRDLFGAPSPAAADARLKEFAGAFARFAEQIYHARER